MVEALSSTENIFPHDQTTKKLERRSKQQGMGEKTVATAMATGNGLLHFFGQTFGLAEDYKESE